MNYDYRPVPESEATQRLQCNSLFDYDSLLLGGYRVLPNLRAIHTGPEAWGLQLYPVLYTGPQGTVPIAQSRCCLYIRRPRNKNKHLSQATMTVPSMSSVDPPYLGPLDPLG